MDYESITSGGVNYELTIPDLGEAGVRRAGRHNEQDSNIKSISSNCSPSFPAQVIILTFFVSLTDR